MCDSIARVVGANSVLKSVGKDLRVENIPLKNQSKGSDEDNTSNETNQEPISSLINNIGLPVDL